MGVNLLIRDVPEAVRDALAERARARGQSMQAYLYELVTTDVRRSGNLALLDAVRAIGGGIEAEVGETARTLRALREAREAVLSEQPEHP